MKRETFGTKCITVTVVISRPGIYVATWKMQTACLLKERRWLNFCKIILEPVTSNGVISKVEAVLYVVLSKAKKHVPFGELVGTTECMTL
jgi:hypothetical protein